MVLPEVCTRILDRGLEVVYGLQPYVKPTLVLGEQDSFVCTMHESRLDRLILTDWLLKIQKYQVLFEYKLRLFPTKLA